MIELDHGGHPSCTLLRSMCLFIQIFWLRISFITGRTFLFLSALAFCLAVGKRRTNWRTGSRRPQPPLISTGICLGGRWTRRRALKREKILGRKGFLGRCLWLRFHWERRQPSPVARLGSCLASFTKRRRVGNLHRHRLLLIYRAAGTDAALKSLSLGREMGQCGRVSLLPSVPHSGPHCQSPLWLKVHRVSFISPSAHPNLVL